MCGGGVLALHDEFWRLVLEHLVDLNDPRRLLSAPGQHQREVGQHTHAAQLLKLLMGVGDVDLTRQGGG